MTEEEYQGLLLLIGLIGLGIGYYFGVQNGRRDLLAFICAMRITHKEQ